jgi:hypothetical protein
MQAALQISISKSLPKSLSQNISLKNNFNLALLSKIHLLSCHKLFGIASLTVRRLISLSTRSL